MDYYINYAFYGVINKHFFLGISMMLIASNLTLIAYFSQNIVKAYTLGDGSSQMITSIIQIVCLLVGGNSRTSGMIYFGVGTSLFIIGLLLYMVTKKSQFYRYDCYFIRSRVWKYDLSSHSQPYLFTVFCFMENHKNKYRFVLMITEHTAYFYIQ